MSFDINILKCISRTLEQKGHDSTYCCCRRALLLGRKGFDVTREREIAILSGQHAKWNQPESTWARCPTQSRNSRSCIAHAKIKS